MTKSSSVQAKPSQGLGRPMSGMLERQHTLGPHISVQREAEGQGIDSNAPTLVRDVLGSPGRPLDAATRAAMEPRFGHDFSNVRVHSDDRAAASARAVNANAYTAGNHVAFAAGKYSPETQGGQRLMAHELTHVVQQASGPVAGHPVGSGVAVSEPSDPFEKHAQKVASAFTAAPSGRPQTLATLPGGPMSVSSLCLQRDAADVIGAIAGVASLGVAIAAYARPPEALNPAPVTGGFTINPNPFSFNTVQQTPAMPQVTPVKEPPSHRAEFLQAQRGTPTIHPILAVRTDAKNHVLVNLVERHDGLNIVDASIRTGTMEGFLGGSRGSSAMINFSAFQTPPAGSDLFSAPEPVTAAPEPAKGAPKGKPAAPSKAAAPAPPESAASPEPAEVTISYTGTNAKDQGAPQNFAGSFTLNALGSIDVKEPELTNGIGSVTKEGELAVVDYRKGYGATWQPGEKGDYPGPEPPGQQNPKNGIPGKSVPEKSVPV